MSIFRVIFDENEPNSSTLKLSSQLEVGWGGWRREGLLNSRYLFVQCTALFEYTLETFSDAK